MSHELSSPSSRNSMLARRLWVSVACRSASHTANPSARCSSSASTGWSVTRVAMSVRGGNRGGSEKIEDRGRSE